MSAFRFILIAIVAAYAAAFFGGLNKKAAAVKKVVEPPKVSKQALATFNPYPLTYLSRLVARR